MNLFNPGAVFGVVGGDFRQAALAKGLLEDGYPVRVFCIERPPQFLPSQLCCENLDGLSGCDAVVLPLPVSNDDRLLNAPLSTACVPLCDLFSRCRSDALLFGGKVSGWRSSLGTPSTTILSGRRWPSSTPSPPRRGR